MKTFAFQSLVSILFLTLLSPKSLEASAPVYNCFTTVYDSKLKTISAVKPFVHQMTSKYEDLEFIIERLKGNSRTKNHKAKSKVNIYLDGRLYKTYNFKKGYYYKQEVLTLNNVKGKQIKVVISNESVAKLVKFVFKIRTKNKTSSLGDETKHMIPFSKKTIEFDTACKSIVTLNVHYISGAAPIYFTIYTGTHTREDYIISERDKTFKKTFYSGYNHRYKIVFHNKTHHESARIRAFASQRSPR